jgi:transcriptional regulator with GAF, ATPase, and Fis domain/polyferredoxin
MAELLAKTGRDAGRVFPLGDDVTRVGRHPENDVALSDGSVSRYHAHILRRDDSYRIRDVGSAVGTFVNGEQITGEVALDDGDLICVGQTELAFRMGQVKQPQPDVSSAGPTKELPWLREDERAGPLRETSITLSLPSTPRTAAEKLSGKRAEVLSQVAKAIQSVFDLDELLGTLLKVIFDVFRPDRGVILLREAASGKLVPQVTRPPQGELTISRSIIDYAVEHRMCLLVADTAGDQRFRGAESIQAQSIQAAICSPLICKEKVLGALYIDTQIDLLSYCKEDLALLSVIAANAAIAIENAILIREKQAADRLAEGQPGPLVAQSASMQVVDKRIAELCRVSGPVLITGEAGTGKFFAAQTIHRCTGRHHAPFVHLDCLTVAGHQAGQVLFGSAACWGVCADAIPAHHRDGFAPPGSGTQRRDLQDDDALRRADGGTLVLRHIGALDLASQEILWRYLKAQASAERVSPRARLIATTCEDLGSLVEAGRFFAPLAAQLSANLLEMPPLRERKEDILLLSRLFLSQCKQRPHEYEQELNKSAQRALCSLQYRHRNVAELREAVELAGVIADGPEIGGEHIFTGPKDTGQRIEYDLGQAALIPWLARKTVSNILQTAVLLLFLAIAGASLAAGDTLAGQVANALVWGLWWPGLMALFLFVGRVWCPFCPISKAGRIVGSIWSFNLRPPQWMKRTTGWITALLFFVIIWSEHVFRMPQTPVATGIFLLTLMALSVVLCIVYAREVWCRYVCPLGSLSAGYSVSSLLHVHATPSICASECQTHECFKGTGSDAGCPVYHHPLYVRDAHFCKLCLTCVRTCPHRSTRIYLRPLLRDVWRMGDLSVTLVPFCLVALLLTMVMLASHRELLGIAGVGGFTAAACLAVAGAAVLSAGLPKMLSRDADLTVTSRVSFALLLLAWGPLMAFHLENIPGLGALEIRAAAGSFWVRHFPSLQVSLLSVLQLGTVLLAAGFAAITLGRIRVHAAKQGIAIVPWGWRILLGICALYFLATVALVLFGGTST